GYSWGRTWRARRTVSRSARSGWRWARRSRPGPASSRASRWRRRWTRRPRPAAPAASCSPSSGRTSRWSPPARRASGAGPWPSCSPTPSPASPSTDEAGRASVLLVPVGQRLLVGTGGDTTTGAIVGVDSLKLSVTITRRDTSAHNLTLVYYRLPLDLDSTKTFADLAGAWTTADSLRSLNVDDLLAQPTHSALGDSVYVDTLTNRVTVIAKLDSASAPYVVADSGKAAFGVKVVADSRASIALGSVEAGLGPLLTW